MDAHSQDTAGADSVRTFDTLEDAAAALAGTKAEPLPEDEEQPEQDDAETEEQADDADLEDGEQDGETDEEGEPDDPAIPAPVSLKAEEKAIFEQLPKEAQRVWAESESRRNREVQEVTTRAAEAQRTAAADATAKSQAIFAQQAMQIAQAYAPRPPSPDLAQVNPGEYIAQKARWEAAQAQHDDFMQQVFGLSQQVEEYEAQQTQAWKQEQIQVLSTVPEFADPAQRASFLASLDEVGAELGYSLEARANAGATDILALKKAAEWKAKAEKYDASQSHKMQRVRDAKTARPNAATPVKAGKARALSEQRQRFGQSGSLDDAAALLAAMRR